MSFYTNTAVVLGGGDLGTGAAFKLYQEGLKVIVLELSQPRMVRRQVCFAEAVYSQEHTVEGCEAFLMDRSLVDDFLCSESSKGIPVIVDPLHSILNKLSPQVLVDGRMIKKELENLISLAPITIGLGPGFTAQVNVTCVVETARGPYLGNVIYEGSALPDTGIPGMQGGESIRRLLKAPCRGVFKSQSFIGDMVQEGQVVAYVGDEPVKAKIPGVLRGLLHQGLNVEKNEKIGDVDPRGKCLNIFNISDKAKLIGESVFNIYKSFNAKERK